MQKIRKRLGTDTTKVRKSNLHYPNRYDKFYSRNQDRVPIVLRVQTVEYGRKTPKRNNIFLQEREHHFIDERNYKRENPKPLIIEEKTSILMIKLPKRTKNRIVIPNIARKSSATDILKKNCIPKLHMEVKTPNI